MKYGGYGHCWEGGINATGCLSWHTFIVLKGTTVKINTSHQKVNRRSRLNENPLSVIDFRFLAAAVSLSVTEHL